MKFKFKIRRTFLSRKKLQKKAQTKSRVAEISWPKARNVWEKSSYLTIQKPFSQTTQRWLHSCLPSPHQTRPFSALTKQAKLQIDVGVELMISRVATRLRAAKNSNRMPIEDAQLEIGVKARNGTTWVSISLKDETRCSSNFWTWIKTSKMKVSTTYPCISSLRVSNARWFHFLARAKKPFISAFTRSETKPNSQMLSARNETQVPRRRLASIRVA